MVIDLLARVVSGRLYCALCIVNGLVGSVTMAYVSWLGYLFTAKRFAFGQMDPMLDVPTGFFYLPIPIGAFLMSTAFLFEACKAAFGGDSYQASSKSPVVAESE